MTIRSLPPQEFLRECFRYDSETGEVWWRVRPEHHFISPEVALGWNNRSAGALAMQSINEGYRQGELVHEGRRVRLRAQRVIWKLMTGEEPEMVDHRDLDTLNNRFGNLRASDKMGNRHNSPGVRTHPLPKGVVTSGGKFLAAGHYKGRKISLGTYTSPAEAHAAYCAWARPLHGEFFNPGPPKPTVFD
jgi:hypothetical protein